MDWRVQWLVDVWKEDGVRGWVFLMYRDDDGTWHDEPVAEGNWSNGNFELPNEGETVYFCPYQFRKPRRLKENALASHWLHADLDEIEPGELELLPSTAWETSPGRFQCLWLMTMAVPARQHGAINQKLNYFSSADRGGWSITKALRVPGSISTKYEEPFEVRLLWPNEGPVARPQTIWRKVKEVDTPGNGVGADDLPTLTLPEGMTASAVVSKHKGVLPTRAVRLIEATRARGDRSAVMWKLEKLMLEAGVAPEEVLIAVRETVWNKYRGQRREVKRLWTEIQKASATVGVVDAGPERKSKKKIEEWATPANVFLWQRLPEPGWLVDGIWSLDAHGLIAGEEKTYKSVIAMDLAVSVATGTPFLNTFAVPRQGPVLMIQEENKPSIVQDRIRKILHSRGLLGSASLEGSQLVIDSEPDIPLWVKNQGGFDLKDEKQMDHLEKFLDKFRPALLILDPFYLVSSGVDENRQSEVAPLLQRLLRLKVKYKTGILLIHHYKKAQVDNPVRASQRMSGTGVFGRWFESAVFVESTEDEYEVKLVPQHREAPPTGVITLSFQMGNLGELDYHVTVNHSRDPRVRIVAMVQDRGVVKLSKLAEFFDMDPRTMKKMCQKAGLVVEPQRDVERGRPAMVVRAA